MHFWYGFQGLRNPLSNHYIIWNTASTHSQKALFLKKLEEKKNRRTNNKKHTIRLVQINASVTWLVFSIMYTN